MGSVTLFNSERMQAIEDGTVTAGLVDVDGHLILTRHDGSTSDAGNVVGPMGPMGPTGVVVPYAGATAPTGWYICDGSAKNRTTDAALFAAIGTKYGAGDGSTTFNLPNAARKMLIGVDPSDSDYALGATGGEEEHVLSTDEMPVHTHTQNSHNHTQASHNHTQASHSHPITPFHRDWGLGAGLGTGGIATDASNPATGTTSATTATNTATTATNTATTAVNNNTGGGSAHNNMPPFLAMNMIIKN